MYNRDNDLKRNASGCLDLTAYEAIKRTEYLHKKKEDTDPEYTKRCKLIRNIERLCRRCGFEVVGRITLKSRKTGEIFK